jgi:hypothetical protein
MTWLQSKMSGHGQGGTEIAKTGHWNHRLDLSSPCIIAPGLGSTTIAQHRLPGWPMRETRRRGRGHRETRRDRGSNPRKDIFFCKYGSFQTLRLHRKCEETVGSCVEGQWVGRQIWRRWCGQESFRDRFPINTSGYVTWRKPSATQTPDSTAGLSLTNYRCWDFLTNCRFGHF